ncbi:hypothetical protein [Streptomyces prunicolor]
MMPQPRKPNRRRPRSPGVMLRGRAVGLHYWDDEIHADGGKAKLHRRVRQHEKTELRRELLTRP